MAERFAPDARSGARRPQGSADRAGTPGAGRRFSCMDIKDIIAPKAPDEQGRAPGLYDEQLQRQQQEKALFCAQVTEAEQSLFLAAPASASMMNRLRRALHLG